MQCDSVSKTIERPLLLRVRRNLTLALFTCMKVMTARHVLVEALRAGLVKPGGIVADTTSGTYGLGLATVGAEFGVRVILVVDPSVDLTLRRHLEGLGATLVVVDQPNPQTGWQGSRLERLATVLAETGAYWTSQYDNPSAKDAYAGYAETLLDELPFFDTLVGAVGSGGSTCGTSKFLRMAGHPLQLVGVDTPGSVLFGQLPRPRLLGGLGSSIPMPNLDHTAFDEVHWVSAEAAFWQTRELLSQGIFVGPTTGAAFIVADHLATAHPQRGFVVTSPDSGTRYLHSVFDQAWLEQMGVTLPITPPVPREVSHPRDGEGDWTFLRWNRRTLSEVMEGNKG